MIQTANEFVDGLNDVIEELDEETPLVFIRLEQHMLLVSSIEESGGNLHIVAGKSAGRFGE